MFGTIRKHQSWLWILIIGVTILGMIVWTNNTGNGNNGRGPGDFGSIDNKAITTTEMRQAEKDVTLMYMLQTHPHQWPDTSGGNVERQAYQQVYILRKMAELNIHADPDAAARLANAIITHWEQGESITMDKLVDSVKSKGFTPEDLEHYLENEVAFKQLRSIVGLGGKVVTPDEIKSLYVQNYQDLSADAVFFSASNSLAMVTAPTPAVLGEYYTNQQAMYREPDKLQLSYVYFNVTNFVPQAEQALGTNLNHLVDLNLAKIGTNFSQLGKTPEEARAKLRELIALQAAETNVAAIAGSFQNELVNKGTNFLENLAALAKAKGLEVKETKPFDKQFGPGEINFGANYPVASLFELNSEQPLLPGGPLSGVDGAYVLVFNKLIPSHIPPLSDIRTRVENDYKFQQALRIAQVNGRSFAQTVTNEMAHGKTFAQTADATRVKPVALPPFSRETPRMPEVENMADVSEFKNIAFGTPVGSVSRFIETPMGGFVVHVKQLLPVDEAKMAKQLPEFSNLVRERRENEAFNLWFSIGWTQELNRGLRDVAILRQQQ